MNIVSKNLVKQTRLAVASEFDQVVLQIGDATMKFDYQTALTLSQWLRVKAKEAKRFAGDTSRHWSAIGTLTDASQTRG